MISRVSTHDQEDKFSLGAQTTLILEYAQQNRIRIAKKYIFAESAKDSDTRKIFKEILDYLSKHEQIHYLLVEKVDRLSRNFEDYINVDGWLKKSEHNKLVFVKQNLIIHQNSLAHERFQWGIHTLLANNTSNNMGDEISKGMKQKAEMGIFPGKTPIGYKNQQEFVNGNDIRTIIVDPVRFPLIEKCFQYYASGNYSLRTLSQKMYEEGLTMRKTDKKLTLHGMDDILRNEFYIGNFIWNKKKYYNGTHPHAISASLFDLVKTRLGEKGKAKFRKHAFAYKGVMKCGYCGFSITGSIEKKYIYYGCNHYIPCNQKNYIREEEVDKQIGSLLDCLKIPDEVLPVLKEQLKEDHESQANIQNKVLEDLKRRLTILKNRQDKLYNDKLDEIISLEFFENKQKEFTLEIENLTKQIAKYGESNINYYQTGSIILELATHAKEIFLNRTAEEKRLLLNFVFSKIVLKDKKLEFQYKKPFDLIIGRSKDNDWWTRGESNSQLLVANEMCCHYTTGPNFI